VPGHGGDAAAADGSSPGGANGPVRSVAAAGRAAASCSTSGNH